MRNYFHQNKLNTIDHRLSTFLQEKCTDLSCSLCSSRKAIGQVKLEYLNRSHIGGKLILINNHTGMLKDIVLLQTYKRLLHKLSNSNL